MKLWSHDHIRNSNWVMWQNFVGNAIDWIYDVITFISKYLYFQKGWGSHFYWHHQNYNKIITIFIITIFKDSWKVKINRDYVSKCNLYLYFLITTNLLISGEKILMLAELKRCVTWFKCFLDLLWVRYNSAKFQRSRKCTTDFREGPFCCPTAHPPPVKSLESPSWIWLKNLNLSFHKKRRFLIKRISSWCLSLALTSKTILPLLHNVLFNGCVVNAIFYLI